MIVILKQYLTNYHKSYWSFIWSIRFTYAEIKKIISSFLQKPIEMEFRGWDVQLQNPIYYSLKFSGVTEFEQVLPQPKPLLKLNT